MGLVIAISIVPVLFLLVIWTSAIVIVGMFQKQKLKNKNCEWPMSILINKNTKCICKGIFAPAAGLAVRVDRAIVLPHSFTYPAFAVRERTP